MNRAKRRSTARRRVPSERGELLVGTASNRRISPPATRSHMSAVGGCRDAVTAPLAPGVSGEPVTTSQRAMPASPAARKDRPSGAKANWRASPGNARQAAGKKIGAAGSQRRTEPSKPPVAICRASGANATARYAVDVTRQGSPPPARVRFPELDRRVQAAGGQHPAQRRERQAGHHVGVPRHRHLLAPGRRVPQPHLTVFAASREHGPIGCEGEGGGPCPYGPRSRVRTVRVLRSQIKI